MFDFANDNGELSHMPFICYSDIGNPVYFWCKNIMGFWKIYYSLDGVSINRLNTGLPDDVVECSPTAEYENNNFTISFCAGGGEADRQFYLYKMVGFDGELTKLEKADYGYFWSPKTVFGLRSGVFYIKDTGKVLKYEILDADFIYRLSYIPEDPNQLLITGQLKNGDWFSWIFNVNTNEIHAVIADGIVAYKCCFFKGSCFYASKNDGDGFEDRHIVEAKTVEFLQLDKDKIIMQAESEKTLACIDCYRKHLASCLAYCKEVLNGHGAGSDLDHRADAAGELINAEHHANALNNDLAIQIRAIRKSLESKLWQPEQTDLENIKNMWINSFNYNQSTCNCNGGK